MEIKRQIVVFDAADLHAESTFWAAVPGGTVEAEDDWHTVPRRDVSGPAPEQVAPRRAGPDPASAR